MMMSPSPSSTPPRGGGRSSFSQRSSGELSFSLSRLMSMDGGSVDNNNGNTMFGIGGEGSISLSNNDNSISMSNFIGNNRNNNNNSNDGMMMIDSKTFFDNCQGNTSQDKMQEM